MDNCLGGIIQKLFDGSDSLKDFGKRREVGEWFLMVNASPFLQSVITEFSCENHDKSGPLRLAFNKKNRPSFITFLKLCFRCISSHSKSILTKSKMFVGQSSQQKNTSPYLS